MFIMCAEDYKTAFAYYNLGVASYHLGEYEEAERVLSLVNYMDPTHALTWAYLALVLLKKPDAPLFAAYQTMNEAIKLNLTDSGVMYEIAMSWIEHNSFIAAKDALENTIQIRVGQSLQAQVDEMINQAEQVLNDNKDSDFDKLKGLLRNTSDRFLSKKGMMKAADIMETYVSLLAGEIAIDKKADFLLDSDVSETKEL